MRGKQVLRKLVCFLFLWGSLCVHAQELKLVLPVGHTSTLTDAKFSPDNKYILTASWDRTIKIWEAASGKLLDELRGHNGEVEAMDFSKDGSLLMTAGNDGTIKLWDWKSRKLIKNLSDYGGAFLSVRYSPDDATALSVLFGDDNVLHLYNTNDGSRQAVPKGIGLRLVHAIYSKDGKSIIGGYKDSTIKIWNLSSQKLERLIDQLPGRVFLTDLSPDGRYVAAALTGGKAVIADITKGRIIQTINAHREKINCLRFTPDGQSIITGSDDKIVKFWDARSGSLKKEIHSSGNIKNISFSTDAKYMVVAQSLSASVWRTSDDQQVTVLKEHAAGLNSVQFSPDGKKILVSSVDYLAYLWDVSGVHAARNFRGHTYPVNDASFSKSGRYVASGSSDSTARIWDAETGQLLRSFNGHTGWVTSAQVSPDEKFILTASRDCTAIVWNIQTGEKAFTLRGVHDADLRKAFYSHDGRHIITLSSNYSNESNHHDIAIWNAADGTPIRSIKSTGHWGSIDHLFLTTDSKTLIAIYGNKTILYYSFDTGADYHQLNAGDFENAGFSPDGKEIYLFLRDHTVAIYDLQGGNLKTVLKGHENTVSGLAYSPDKRLIATIAEDNTTRVWDASSGSLLYTAIMLQDDYFVQLPSRHYIATPNAAKLLHYVSPDLKVVTFDQLDVKYNRPDLVLQAAGSRDTMLVQSYRKAYEKRVRKLGIDTTAFGEETGLPETEIVGGERIGFEQKQQSLRLHIKGSDKQYPLDRFNVWVNEVPLFGLKGIRLRDKKSRSIDTTIVVLLSEGTNVIETSVTNVNGTESYRMPLTVNHTPATPAKGKLYFVGIGIDRFKDNRHNLNYSVKDVRDLALGLKGKYGSAIVIDTLFNETVEGSRVAELKKRLLTTSVNDRVILSYSGHGLLSTDFDYYLSTYDVSFSSPEQGGLPYEALESLLDSLPARKKMMLIDACHSGEVDKEEMQKYKLVLDQKNGEGLKGLGVENTDSTVRLGMKNSFELMQELFVNVGRSTGATIISAAAGTQLAQERGDLKNGVFTYAILEYMKEHPSATVSELRRYVNSRVPELTHGLQVPTTRSETKQVDWKVW